MIPITAASTLASLFATRVQQTPADGAFRRFVNGEWREITWGEAARDAARWQAALMRENLTHGDRVSLCLHNRLEWMLFDQAALSLGLVVVPLYYNDRPDNMAWCVNDSGARLLLLEDAAQFAELRGQLPNVERIVCLSGQVDDPRAMSVEDWLRQAEGVHELIPPVAGPDDLATIVYTSGTTGRPKGVMLTHANIVRNMAAMLDAVPEIVRGRHTFLSFLPLSHMFERTVGYYIPICLGSVTAYARGIPELPDDLLSQKPTLLVSVPRIFERVYAKIEASLPADSMKRRLFEKTVAIGWKRFTGEATLIERLQWPLLDLLVARKLRSRLGGRLQYILLGGAALAPHLLKAFTAMGFTFVHGYGLTETSPVIACNRISDNDPLSVGKPVAGVETRISENGELLVRGHNIMRGYWNNAAATRAVIDKEGWLHTGDVVEVRNGKIYIRGRIKDIIVLSNGEKIPPGDAEQAILQDPVFEQVMVVGEGRPALGLIAVSTVTDDADLCARANAQLRAFPGYARIQHILRVPEPWSVENGMLTPTLKLKRNKIEEKYAREIEAMYQTRSICNNNKQAATAI